MDIIIKDNNGISVAEELDQTSRTPSITTTSLIAYHRYTILARVKMTDDTYTAYMNVGEYICNDGSILPYDPTTNYLDKYNFTQELQTKGPIVTSTIELFNNDILTTKHNDNNIYRNIICNGKLKQVGSIIELDTFKSMMEKSYTNIIPLRDGKILVDYNAVRKVDIYDDIVPESIRNNMINNHTDRYEYRGIIIINNHDGQAEVEVLTHRPKFELYDYNPITKTLTLLHTLTRDDELYGTSVTNSFVQYDSGYAYYLPTMAVAGVDSDIPITVQLKKLDLQTLTIVEQTQLPIDLHAYGTLFKLKTDIYFTSGSLSSVVKNNITTWNRDNHILYRYNTTTHAWYNIGSIPVDIPITMYALASYIRKDGRVVFFNNVTDNDSIGDQRTVVYEHATNSFVLMDNDTPDGMLYRNAIQLQNGDIIRMSTRTEDPQLVYTYISDTAAASELSVNDTIDIITDLRVPVDTEVQVEDLYRYDTVVIEGSDDTHTGKLKWLDGTQEYIFKWNDLVITRETALTQNLYPYPDDVNEWNSVTILEGASLSVENIIWVYDENTTFTIAGPVAVGYITVANGSELIVT
jgi:hypothetical protein